MRLSGAVLRHPQLAVIANSVKTKTELPWLGCILASRPRATFLEMTRAGVYGIKRLGSKSILCVGFSRRFWLTQAASSFGFSDQLILTIIRFDSLTTYPRTSKAPAASAVGSGLTPAASAVGSGLTPAASAVGSGLTDRF